MSRFGRVAEWFSQVAGSPVATGIAFMVILCWAVSGPFLGYSEAWQLTINTATTIITFLMVFLIQAAQNRNDARLHEKLDELIHSISTANDAVADS